MKLFRSGLAALSVLAAAVSSIGSAQAFTVDFANIADTEGEAGYLSWSRSFSGTTLSLSASTTVSGSEQAAYAYFDAGNAGLGVCKVVTNAAQCNPSSDDNVTDKELLKLSFDQAVTLDNIVFRNGNHGQTWNNGADFQVSIDGSSFTSYALTGLFDVDLVGSEFVFVADLAGNQSVDDQFYISSITADANAVSTPLPGTVALFGLGLLGFSWWKRRA